MAAAALPSTLIGFRPAWGARGRRGALEAWPRRVPFVIICKMGGGSECFGAIRKLSDPIEDRHQIDVGECEPVIDEIAGLGDCPVEDSQLLPYRRHDGLDRPAVRPSVGSVRGD